MPAYFIVSIQITDPEKRPVYDEYIEKVKPIVESYGGEYLARSENISVFTGDWEPDRVIIIRFETREKLEICFASEKYQKIAGLRVQSVLTNAIIVEDG